MFHGVKYPVDVLLSYRSALRKQRARPQRFLPIYINGKTFLRIFNFFMGISIHFKKTVDRRACRGGDRESVERWVKMMEIN